MDSLRITRRQERANVAGKHAQIEPLHHVHVRRIDKDDRAGDGLARILERRAQREHEAGDVVKDGRRQLQEIKSLQLVLTLDGMGQESTVLPAGQRLLVHVNHVDLTNGETLFVARAGPEGVLVGLVSTQPR